MEKTISTSKPSAKPAKVIKKVDLGAAASYGKDAAFQNSDLMSSSTQPQTQTNKIDIFDDFFSSESQQKDDNDDDFNPRADTSLPIPKQAPLSDFGDFNNAFASSNINSANLNDEFADFTSAFNSNMSLSNPVPQTQTSLMDLNHPNVANPVPNASMLPLDKLLSNSDAESNNVNLLQAQNLANQTLNQNDNNKNNNNACKFLNDYNFIILFLL